MLSFFSIFYHLFYHLYALSPFHSAQHSILGALLQKFILCAAQYSGYSSMHVCVLSWFSHVQLFSTPWTAAHQVSMSMESSRQEYWSELPCPPPGDLSDPGLEPISPASPASPALQTDSFTTEPPRSPYSPISVHNSLSKVPEHAGSKVGNTHKMLQYKHPLWVSPSPETGSQEVVSAWVTPAFIHTQKYFCESQIWLNSSRSRGAEICFCFKVFGIFQVGEGIALLCWQLLWNLL